MREAKRQTSNVQVISFLFLSNRKTSVNNNDLEYEIKIMNKQTNIVCATVIACSMTGCASNGGLNPIVAGAACTAIGVAVGVTTGKAGWGAGAAGGCLAIAWSISHYLSTQIRTVKEDQKLYGYGLDAPVTSVTVKIRNANATPNTIKMGEEITAITEYSVMVPKEGQKAEVTETSILKKDGTVLFSADPKTEMRAAGGWNMEIAIPMPRDAEPGTYIIEQRIKAGTSNDVRELPFVVVG